MSVGQVFDLLGTLVSVLPGKVFGDYAIEGHVHVSGSARGGLGTYLYERLCSISMGGPIRRTGQNFH